MKSFRMSFALSSVVLLLVLAVSPFKDYFREWKSYQHQYNSIVASLPQKVKPVETGIRQIYNEKLDRVDRCVTCHLGLKEEALRDTREPYRTHPHIYHDIEEFGCTICHEGQGLATEFKESIGKVEYWDKPIIPAQYMEASCAKCHKEEQVPQAPVLNRGRKLIETLNCTGCHAIGGYEKQWAPHLDGIGAKVNRQWMLNWLKDPQAYDTSARMPEFFLTADEANNLSDFLMTQTSVPGEAGLDPLPGILTSATADQKAKLVELGSTRFKEARCISCHPINGKGGSAATDLGKVASKVSEQWLYTFIGNPKRLMPGVLMPRYRFTGQELTGVVEYMESEFVDYDAEGQPVHTADPQSQEKGRALFKKLNCGGCHVLGGVTNAEAMAPDLSSIGSKKLYEIDFGKSTIEKTLPSYLSEKLLNPRSFSSAMQMPKFNLSGEDITAITVAMLGNTTEKIPEEFMVRPKPRSTFAPQGEFGRLVDDLACMGCHVMKGRGKLIATDLSLEASQAQRKWIEEYFKVPYSLRPILTERMPNFFLTGREISTLADYMDKVFIADSLDGQVPMDASTIGIGKGLYFEKYGCQGCHQIGSKGGYVGPPLDKLSARLKPGWVFRWLKNPEAFKPESIEPDNKMSDADATALTAYLMSLQ